MSELMIKAMCPKCFLDYEIGGKTCSRCNHNNPYHPENIKIREEQRGLCRSCGTKIDEKYEYCYNCYRRR